MKNEILQEWVRELPLVKQAILISVLRGCDVDSKTLKEITKLLRSFIVTDFNSNTNYVSYGFILSKDIAYTILIDGNKKSLHWTQHIISAVRVLAEHIPYQYFKIYWSDVIDKMEELNYLNIPPYLYRLLNEVDELKTKIDNLSKFLSGDTKELTPIEINEMHEQMLLMKDYLTLLISREETQLGRLGLVKDSTTGKICRMKTTHAINVNNIE